mmetsp:Transcript_16174/g.24394  ORF Transcript_16174/g.24394 Transcript_16174/m.24394 type:complete len:355 (-) Transcript_16174:15-1079(-)
MLRVLAQAGLVQLCIVLLSLSEIRGRLPKRAGATKSVGLMRCKTRLAFVRLNGGSSDLMMEGEADNGSETIQSLDGSDPDGSGEGEADESGLDEDLDSGHKAKRAKDDFADESGIEYIPDEEQLDEIPDDLIPPAILLRNIRVLNNPSPFLSPMSFEVTFECTETKGLNHDLRWKVAWVSSATDDNMDQILEDVLVGPIMNGTSRFVLEAKPPDPNKIPRSDMLGATVVLLSCSYQDRKFLQVGYYVNVCSNEIEAREVYNTTADIGSEMQTEISGPLNASELWRNVMQEEPRVSHFPILWDTPSTSTRSLNARQQLFFNDSAFGDDDDDPEAAVQAALAHVEAQTAATNEAKN